MPRSRPRKSPPATRAPSPSAAQAWWTTLREKLKALELLGNRFCAGFEAEVQEEILKDGPKTLVVRIRIERITGKANR